MVVEAVRFGFMTDLEVRRNSVVKITKPDLVDTLGKPIPGGLYDPVMGPIDDPTRPRCKSCGRSWFDCNGHCGHIDLVYPVYNPLLFNMLSNLVNITCLSCFHFRSGRREVERCVAQLEMIKKGDIVGAKRVQLNSANKKKTGLTLSNDEVEPEDSQGSHSSHSVVLSDGENRNESSRHACWDSIHLSEALNILNEFLKKKVKKCENCEFKNPKISKPTFGWFHVKAVPGHVRSAAIRSSILEVTDSGEDGPSSEVVNASDYPLTTSGEAEAISSIAAANSSKKPRRERSNLRKLNQDLTAPYNFSSGHLLPSEVRDIMRRLWENEDDLCSYIVDIQQQQCNLLGKTIGYSIFFLETILVPPVRFRPPAKGGDSVMEHPHTVLLGKVVQSNIALGQSHQNNAERSKIIGRWMDLQQSINVLFDSKTATSQAQKDATSGICQFLEKKEGIFRQKMMGKRVNFACRSVISPDPYLAVNEIGIPPYFAKRLTYPERVTPWNAEKLRNAIINGPEIHPGALVYADSVATIKLSPNQRFRLPISRKLLSSRGAATQTGKNSQLDFEGKTVHRHLRDGDIVLVNRQPTLHKPSIMAHVVRVLKGEKTLRMHYANCSSYNADFDGDEINVHFPQDEISRAEAYNIVNANEQYIVPTRGDTVRGLIQDHIVAALLLTLKDTFLTRSEFNQLLYGSGVFASRPGSFHCNISRKASLLYSEGSVEAVLPTIWKPKPLWTGKQVITALLNRITQGCAPFTIKNQAKLPRTYFTSNNSQHKDKDEDQNAEHIFFVWKNELVHGVIDKAQFGKFGLVHTVQELYGSGSAGILLSAFSRLFTIFLQTHGFTCGLDDLMILPHYDEQRKEKLEGDDVGLEVHCDFVKFKPGQIGPEELQLEIEKAICRDRESATAFLDMKMKNKLTTKLTKEGSQVLQYLLTKGLYKPFPKNGISVMTTTGAKGSTVNFQQISAYLGQQELEGKRVPRMISGKTLPSFPPWDSTSRAGGFITDRFLSGLRPQEYYFHCMAGREGLVDTAVKTSRSGYLQRCLIKNLESLKVCYDYTVRDADGSVIQFYYGEDGVDVHKTSFLKNFKALEDNQETIWQKFQNRRGFNNYITKLPEGIEEEARQYIQEVQGRTSGKRSSMATENLHESRKRRNELQQDKDKAIAKEKNWFIKLVKQKYLSSLAESGEPVGVIAAQSVGEPSTQMTLNTFHLAGRGEMNVTLGIPRLQEILMTASEVIKTPILTCPFSKWKSRSEAVSLVSSVKMATIADLVESMDVQVSFQRKPVSRVYKLTMHLKDTEFVSLEDTRETLKTTFLKELEDALENHVMFLSKISGIKNLLSSSRSESSIETADDESGDKREDDEDEDDDDDQGDDLGSDAQKRRQQNNDEMDYENGSDVDPSEDESSADEKGENTVDDLDDADSQGEETEHFNDVDEASNVQNADEVKSEAKSRGKNGISASEKIDLSSVNASEKRKRRAFYMEIRGLSFEFHFRFTSEPDLLLAQIAQRTAKKVYVKRCGKISQCKLVQHDPDEKTIIWDDTKTPKRRGGKEHDDAGYWAVKASGVDFKSIWEMQDDLDLNRLYSNNIHAMLKTYGVEAARATIIREIKQVFDIYGVKIDYRHLSLIADYMTHTGGYRPMSRFGISDSTSPFLKMSFETASKFIVEAATHGLTDNLETPSSRICLGLPVKMGTGSFDVMQKVM